MTANEERQVTAHVLGKEEDKEGIKKARVGAFMF